MADGKPLTNNQPSRKLKRRIKRSVRSRDKIIIHHCPQCNRPYQHRYTMLKHLREECGKPPAYRCIECDYRTKVKGNLKKHLLKTHKMNMNIVVETGLLQAKIEVSE